jgi:hypothetical protein
LCIARRGPRARSRAAYRPLLRGGRSPSEHARLGGGGLQGRSAGTPGAGEPHAKDPALGVRLDVRGR